MAVIQDHVDVQAILQTAQAAAKAFGLQLFLIDDEQIPVDVRFRYTTKTSFADDFSNSTSVPYKYANVFFGQKRVASQLMIGRWIEQASKVYFVCEDGYETDPAVYASVTDGAIKFVDSGALTDTVSGIDFTGVTTFQQVLDTINTEIAALVGPNITGLQNGEFKLDALGRLIFEMQTTGSSAPTVILTAPAAGTDLTSATYLNGASGSAVAGEDAESLIEAEQAISDLDDSYYNIGLRALDVVVVNDWVSFATAIEAKEKLLDLVTTSSLAKNPASTTDLGYLCKQLNLKRTMCYYTEKTTEYPDAAVAGCVLPTEEGSTNFAHEDLSLVTDSGLTKPLTASERIALGNKNYVWIEQISPYTIMYNGITSGGEEKRVMVGRDWFVARIREALFTDMVNSPLHAFDNPTLSKVEGIIRSVANEALDRAIIVDTPDRPLVIELPDADDFTAAQRATHTAELLNVFICYINSAINDYTITGTWTL